MPTSIKQTLLDPIVIKIRSSSLRQPILKRLLSVDNFLRRWITFFAFENNVHARHRITKYHQFFIDNIASSDNVLDIGCGIGMLAASVANKANHVTGIDMDQKYLDTASKHHKKENLEYLLGNATTYDFNQKFNIVILSNVLEHIEDRVSLLNKIKPLAPKILIRVPMLDRDWTVLLKKELSIEHRLDPTHYTEYTEISFRNEIKAANLSIEQLQVRFGEIYCVLNNAR